MKIAFTWLFGIGAMLSLFSIYQQKERKKMLFCKLCADVCWLVHYSLLGAWGGVVPNLVGIFRELVFVNRENKKWANFPLWPFFFIACGWALGIAKFESVIDLLPIAASTVVTISLWIKKPTLTKAITLPVSATFIVYDCFVGSYIGIVNESLSILSIIIDFIKRRRKNGD